MGGRVSRVTVIDVLDAGACIGGVLAWIKSNGMLIECSSTDFPHERHIQQAASMDSDGFGDGDGNGYGYGYGDGQFEENK